VDIHDRLKELNRLDLMKESIEAKDWSKAQGPRKIKVKSMEGAQK
jgi:hypothetical protein